MRQIRAITTTSPVELSTDRFLDEAPRQIGRVGARYGARQPHQHVTRCALTAPVPRAGQVLTKRFQAAGVI